MKMYQILTHDARGFCVSTTVVKGKSTIDVWQRHVSKNVPGAGRDSDRRHYRAGLVDGGGYVIVQEMDVRELYATPGGIN
ncbi:MAG TPA: hypothetical protein VLH56_03415 [Dissulfurispiraceae bacterium]|nr:hypothetical protein [Dissulfurispiraceae bacterium]